MALVKRRLRSVYSSDENRPIVGVNIGKNKATDLDRAVEDYKVLFSELSPLVDYITVNISSPNTPGLRELQERGRLIELLSALQGLNRERRPIFVKVAPDLTYEAVEELIQCCVDTRMAGVIATNTTLSREGLKAKASGVLASEVGGLSGRPLFARSLDMVRFIGERLPSELALIGVGGILSVEDAAAMLAAGARAIQVYTGLVYNGPGFVRLLNLGLLNLLDRVGAKSLDELGVAYKELCSGAAGGNCAAI
jgi:dihydroorotate dehydrogenase